MKARINPRRLQPDMRPKIRERMRAEIRLVMAEVFGWSPHGERWQALDDFAQKFFEKYDALYDDPRAECDAILNRARADGIDYDARQGSGLKVDYAREHDITYLPYLIGLRKLYGFGQDRMKRLQAGINEKTRYYNKTFAGDYGDVMPVIENRLSQYGRRSKRA